MESRRRNQVLADKIAAAGFTHKKFGDKLGVSEKTVDNWVNTSALPRLATRLKIPALLDCSIGDLWPDEDSNREMKEIVNVWAKRPGNTDELMWQLLYAAHEQVEIVGCELVFLLETRKMTRGFFHDKAADGCRIRIIADDPPSISLKDRNLLKAPDEISKITSIVNVMTLKNFFPRNVELRLQKDPRYFYYSIFRCDNDMFVSPRLHSMDDRNSPLFHFQRKIDSGIFDTFANSFEALFNESSEVKRSNP